MKILIAVTSPISYALIRGQLMYLKSSGMDVYFACTFDPAIEELVKNEGATYVRFDLKREISFVKDVRAVLKAIKIIKDIQPDIINASTAKAGLIFMIAAQFVSKVYPIFTLRGLRSDTLTGLKKQIVKFTEYISCRLAKKVIVIAPSLREHAVDIKVLSRNKSVVLGFGSSNGVNLNKFTKTEQTSSEALQYRKNLEIENDALVFGYLGRIVQDKGLAEVYQAFQLLQENHKNIYLVLTGSIEASNPLPADILNSMKVNKNVRFIAHSSNVPVILNLYDVLILFSYREGFGNVCIEASAMELPIIVSDIPGLKDTVVDGKTGFLVESKNHKQLSQVMEKYIITDNLASSQGKMGRVRMESFFSSEFIWSLQYETYCKALNENS
jgi:glycosyltransferase involved in cell wall biosynthesis